MIDQSISWWEMFDESTLTIIRNEIVREKHRREKKIIWHKFVLFVHKFRTVSFDDAIDRSTFKTKHSSRTCSSFQSMFFDDQFVSFVGHYSSIIRHDVLSITSFLSFWSVDRHLHRLIFISLEIYLFTSIDQNRIDTHSTNLSLISDRTNSTPLIFANYVRHRTRPKHFSLSSLTLFADIDVNFPLRRRKTRLFNWNDWLHLNDRRSAHWINRQV